MPIMRPCRRLSWQESPVWQPVRPRPAKPAIMKRSVYQPRLRPVYYPDCGYPKHLDNTFAFRQVIKLSTKRARTSRSSSVRKLVPTMTALSHTDYSVRWHYDDDEIQMAFSTVMNPPMAKDLEVWFRQMPLTFAERASFVLAPLTWPGGFFL